MLFGLLFRESLPRARRLRGVFAKSLRPKLSALPPARQAEIALESFAAERAFAGRNDAAGLFVVGVATVNPLLIFEFLFLAGSKCFVHTHSITSAYANVHCGLVPVLCTSCDS